MCYEFKPTTNSIFFTASTCALQKGFSLLETWLEIFSTILHGARWCINGPFFQRWIGATKLRPFTSLLTWKVRGQKGFPRFFSTAFCNLKKISPRWGWIVAPCIEGKRANFKLDIRQDVRDFATPLSGWEYPGGFLKGVKEISFCASV